MIYVLSGGSGKLFAVIAVTYPEGSICTCSDGTKTMKAKDTSGKALFNVPSAGTWTVSCTDGMNTDSQSVAITAAGQVENVELAYNLYLYKNGNEYTNITGGWNNRGYTWDSDALQGVTKNADSMVIRGVYNSYRGGVGTVKKVNTSGYSTLKAVGFTTEVYPNNALYLSASKDVLTGKTASVQFGATESEINIDLNSLQGDYYIAIVVDGDTQTPTTTVKKIWLE